MCSMRQLGNRLELDDDELLLQAAAALKADNEPQWSIAAKLGISEGKVTDLLDKARTRHVLLEHAPEFRGDRAVVNAFLERLGGDVEEEALNAYLRGSAKLERLYVVGEDSQPDALEDFAQLAAPAVVAQIREAFAAAKSASAPCRIGVGWGSTLHALVAALARQPKLLNAEQPSRQWVFPVCGAPFALQPEYTCYTSTDLAHRLSLILSRYPNPVPSLLGLPALLPRALVGTSPRDAFLSDENYSAIFGVGGLVDETATRGLLLMGIGGTEGLRRVFSRAMLGKNADAVDQGLLGELVGVPVQRRVPSDAMLAAEVGLAECFTGMRREQLQKARTVVVAQGAEKAPVLREAIRQELVSIAIVDRALATTMGDELKQEHHLPSWPPPHVSGSLSSSKRTGSGRARQ